TLIHRSPNPCLFLRPFSRLRGIALAKVEACINGPPCETRRTWLVICPVRSDWHFGIRSATAAQVSQEIGKPPSHDNCQKRVQPGQVHDALAQAVKLWNRPEHV